MLSNKKHINIVKVLVFRTGGRAFDYLSEHELNVGAIVKIPFGRRSTYGLVIETSTTTTLETSKLKKVADALPEPFCLTKAQIELSFWMAQYYHDNVYVYQSMMLPKSIKQGKIKPYMPQDQYVVNLNITKKLSPKQSACAFWLQGEDCQRITHEALVAEGFGEATIKSLVRLSVLEIASDLKPLEFELSVAQKKAYETILSNQHCSALHGVTASGKTYVYLALIQTILSQKGQVLVLVPEIGLTPQTTAKLRQHLNASSVYWHSQLSDGQKSSVWGAVYHADIEVVIGTRSALFLPFKNLQLIIVDEEHDMSFYQQNRPCFSVRDLAVLMSKKLNIRTVLGTATPSLETFNNVMQDRYQYVDLPATFKGSQVNWHIVDARKQKLQKNIAPQIISQVKLSLEKGNQVLFFLNRRGYAPLTLCHCCGWIYLCSQCDVKLTYSKAKGSYSCHLCQKSYGPVETCQSCGSEALFKVGQGTEKLEDSLKDAFPSAKILRVDADTTSTMGQWAKVRQSILSGQANIIIGTQMLAKGHDFPNLTDVVVLDADYALHATDFRSIERWGQRLKQVAGRCGRGSQQGHVWVQTHLPNHPAFEKLQKNSYDEFASYLLTMRNEAQWPPNHFLAKIKMVADTFFKLERELEKIMCSNIENIELIGPIFPGVQKRQNQFHGYVLLKAIKRSDLANACRYMANRNYRVEVDPQDLEA
ncbi:MAG: primosomal protein N' [Gammaproteobacteria bacterium]|nr:primosomal protein N' [Gammaproteobacteria bacterium]